MTNNDIIDAAVNDPQVISLNARVNGQTVTIPTPGDLMARAATELQGELSSLISKPQISQFVLEKDYTLDLTSSPDTTTDTRGTLFSLPLKIGTVLSVILSSSNQPLRKFNSRSDFDVWYSDAIGDTSTTTTTAECCLVYDRTTAKQWRLMISPGVGDLTSAKIHYLKYLESPFLVSLLPDSMHHLVLAGLKRRMTGGQLSTEYDRDLTVMLKVMDPLVGGSSPMPLSEDDEAFNWRMSAAISGGDWSCWSSSRRR